MEWPRIARILRLCPLVISLVLVSVRGNSLGAKTADDETFCSATIVNQSISPPTYTYPTPADGTRTAVLNWTVNYDCNEGQTSSCGICLYSRIAVSSFDGSRWIIIGGRDLSSSETAPDCGGSWAVSATTTYASLQPDEFYTVYLYATTQDPNGGGCPQFNSNNWTLIGSWVVSGILSQNPGNQ